VAVRAPAPEPVPTVTVMSPSEAALP